ncbi:division/cell wall cluster transcriptional repressor MraZ [Deferribacterales bacterium RsTz2092]|nr:transcriptional regulator MraZ [Deferribacterales bacterium]
MGFKGASIHTINDSGRLSVPAKVREILRSVYGSETLVLAMLGPFIAAYPIAEWEKYEASLLASPPNNRSEATAVRKLYANLEEVVIDKQGRILIPPALRTGAGLTSECIIVGMNSRIEIWDRVRWNAQITENIDGTSGIGSKFNELVL